MVLDKRVIMNDYICTSNILFMDGNACTNAWTC